MNKYRNRNFKPHQHLSRLHIILLAAQMESMAPLSENSRLLAGLLMEVWGCPKCARVYDEVRPPTVVGSFIKESKKKKLFKKIESWNSDFPDPKWGR